MKATVRLSTLAFAAGLAFQPALAEDRYEETLNTRQYLGGFASYVDVDEDRQFDDEGLGYSAFYGRQLSDRIWWETEGGFYKVCLLYTSPSPRDATLSRMPSSA